jgi:lysophospholipase L1-like esterase
VLLTHAVSVTSPPRETDSRLLFAMRVWTPRATEETLAAFPYAANLRIRKVADVHGITVVDLAGSLSTQSSQFLDMVHYTPSGHAQVADMLQPVLF